MAGDVRHARVAGLALLLAALPVAGQPLARLDHVPLVVQDLDAAVTDYRALGFAIKPGRPHANGLRNAHVKFRNGAGIELITAPAARDTLSAHYTALLAQGDPARAAEALPHLRAAQAHSQAALRAWWEVGHAATASGDGSATGSSWTLTVL